MEKLRVENLTKVFGKHPKKILQLLEDGLKRDEIFKTTQHTVGIGNVNFSVEEGETFVIMGLSGSGKSTLIRCLNLLNKPTAGKIIIDEENIMDYDKKQMREFRRNKIAMVFQHFGLFSHKTVIENVEFGLEIKGEKKEYRYKKSLETLKTVGLEGWEDYRISALSGGMKQRVGLARALANDPEIILMDEPFSALDPLIRRDMHTELLDLQSKLKKTIIFITHDVNEAFKLGDRIAVLKEGEIVQIGTPEEILENPENEYIRNFIQDIDRSRILKAENIMRKSILKLNNSQKPKIALEILDDSDFQYGFVVDRETRKIVGVVEADDLIDAIKNKKTIEEVMHLDYITVSKDEYVKEIIEKAYETKYPIAVIDESENYIGRIQRGSLLKALV
ncbi:MAG: glycine betaine/L-proline ABC transporter ATP-binding protein [Clostridiales bacterium]|nr:glycine betaine/L-proline ABC transporter ATP-binding protein [Clostridiales bacterium]